MRVRAHMVDSWCVCVCACGEFLTVYHETILSSLENISWIGKSPLVLPRIVLKAWAVRVVKIIHV